MGLINPTLPTLGELNATEDADIRNSLQTIIAEINGLLDAANIEDGTLTETELTAALLDKLGVSGGGVIRRGKSMIATEETRAAAGYALLSTPDRVSGVVLPTDGLIVVGYQALWKESVVGNGQAAIFVGANQLKIGHNAGAPVVQQASMSGGPGNTYVPLATCAGGLVSRPTSAASSEVTTGQILGVVPASGVTGGPVYIFAAAGTYDISVQFAAITGSVTAKDRKLWVSTAAF